MAVSLNLVWILSCFYFKMRRFSRQGEDFGGEKGEDEDEGSPIEQTRSLASWKR